MGQEEPSHILSPDKAALVLKADNVNIVKKVKEGRTLTSRERAIIQAQASGSDVTLSTAKTIVELATALGVTRMTLSNWRKIKGAPPVNANGSHSVTAWREFVKSKGLKSNDISGDKMEALKARKILAEIEEREMKIAIKKGDYILFHEVEQAWTTLVGKAIALLRSKFENELPPILSGMEAVAIQKECGKAIDEICEVLHTSKDGLV